MTRYFWKYLLLKRLARSRSIYYNSRCGSLINGPRALIRIPARRYRVVQQQQSAPTGRKTASVRPYPVQARGYLVLSQALESPAEDDTDELPGKTPDGPMEQYDQWVANGRLKDDEHQRGIVQALQNLHDELKNYKAPRVVHPRLGLSAMPPPKPSIFGRLLGRKPEPPPKTQLLEAVPQGLYLYGDVGSGKTMLMDMLYQTLPPNITSKTRIHFNHFMQDVHKRLHVMKMKHGSDFDAIPFVGAELAEAGSVLCFDEFQCTDVADAMILRRLLDSLMSHGVVMVATSNRHPDDLYRNGLQRASFLPCIALLKERLRVVNLDSLTDYRRVVRPSANVYRYPLGPEAVNHANRWFLHLGDPKDPPHPTSHTIWGRDLRVPLASGKAAKFTFGELCGSPLSAADYLELCRRYEAFVVTDIPTMDYKTRDLARRFITFIDAVYESRAKLVLTLATKPTELFTSNEDVAAKIDNIMGGELDSAMRSLMDDLGMDMKTLKNSSIFTGDEERFAFARALSRLSEMSSLDWMERRD
ncbi:AFG1-like ATPase-domain-containing protein [Tirmania nivea]|nr:AFG1-like ATPase-domain-containing protein [Tirmania nivea]